VENVAIPQLIAGVHRARRPEARSRALLNRLGLAERLDHWPSELSGGEQQRVAIARALANKPMLLLADEPTGNLDPKTAEQVHREFLQLIEDEGLAVLIATHNTELGKPHAPHRPPGRRPPGRGACAPRRVRQAPPITEWLCPP
jgi:lipoprotein-releasing system ATP-binding protein